MEAASASTPPPEEGKNIDHLTGDASTPVIGYVPPEILEQILVNLPVKSLLRFSTVSKSWSCMVFKFRSRAWLVNIHSPHEELNSGASVRRISLITSPEIGCSSDLICPIEGTQHLLAFCDDLWLVEAGKSLFLWNPWMRSCRELCPSKHFDKRGFLIYGLAYDSATDDYKVLKISRFNSGKNELYSLRSNSWKTIPSSLFYITVDFYSPWIDLWRKLEFVNGAFHWICIHKVTIVSFNLSTEKYGEIAFPATGEIAFPPVINLDNEKWVEVMVMRGKLCVSWNNNWRFVLWVMEEYGVEKSWTKKIDIQYVNTYNFLGLPLLRRPLYFYDNGDILFIISRFTNDKGLFVYEKSSGLVKEIVARDGREIRGGFLFVENLVSPWSRIIANMEGFHKRGNEQINAGMKALEIL